MEVDSSRVIGEITCTGDGTALIHFQASEIGSAKDLLSPWIGAVFAAAAGTSLPTLLLDPTCPDNPHKAAAIEPDEASALLATLVRGFLAGRTRPLPFAPSTSFAIAAALGKGSDVTTILDTAEKTWHAENGDGSRAAATLAWRDRNPFADITEWQTWAREIALPTITWGAFL